MDPRTPVVVAARRTPLATAGRALARVPAHDLAAPVLEALCTDVTGAAPPVDTVVLGCCTGPGGNVARRAALAAGLGTGVPGLSLDGQCGTGLDAVRVGASLVAAGEADLVLAGGTESGSLSGGRRAPFTPEGWPDPDMGAAADALAAAWNVSRERQDAYAARSHERALSAVAAGRFAAELVPVHGVTRDDRPRRLHRAALARFPPAFSPGGSVTAASSCGVSDGAAVVAVVPEQVRAALGVPGLAVRATAAVGVDPALPGLGAAAAVRTVLARADLPLDGVDRLEITEAFAAQVLACTDDLGLDPLGDDDERVCPDGGAIALGHPWAASGAVLLVRLFAALVGQGGGRLGVAACAVGGGQGVAVVVERVG